MITSGSLQIIFNMNKGQLEFPISFDWLNTIERALMIALILFRIFEKLYNALKHYPMRQNIKQNRQFISSRKNLLRNIRHMAAYICGCFGKQ